MCSRTAAKTDLRNLFMSDSQLAMCCAAFALHICVP